MNITPKHAWLSTAILWIGGDLATTYYGLSIGLVESNPLPAAMLEYGFTFLILNKLIFTGFTLLSYYGVKRYQNEIAIGIPIGLSIIGLAITLWNSYLIIIS